MTQTEHQRLHRAPLRPPGLFLLAALLSLAAVAVHAQGTSPAEGGERVLGKAGSLYIPEKEFIERFELLPGLYRRGNRLDEEKLTVMYSLIAEKLLAQEAEARGIDRDTAAMEGMRWLTDMIARDELYREEVAGRVEVNGKEVREGMQEAVRKLLVRYLFFPRREDADRVASDLGGALFDSLQLDTSIASLMDTVTIVWGAAEPSVERAAFSLRRGVSSPVITSSKGFLILELVDEEPNRFYADMQVSVLRERVTDRLRLIKEQARMEEYLGKFLPGKTGYAEGKALKELAIAVSPELVPSQPDSTIVLPRSSAEQLLSRLRGHLDDTCLVAGTKVYSVRAVAGMLLESDFSSPATDPLKVAAEINGRCEVWVRQALLAQEAIRRGLQDRPQVQAQLKEWREAYLAQLMRARVQDSIVVSDVDVYKFRELNGKPLPTPQVRVRTLTTSTPEQMREVLADLSRGAGFRDVVSKYSTVAQERSTGGESGWFAVTQNPPIGELSAQMEPGQIYGPIPWHEGLLLFQLVARRDSSVADTSVAASKRQSAAELKRLLKKQALDRFIAQAASRRGFSIFEDRLVALKVSPVPMMSFRVIGFGGRLFAAPMLPRLYDWVTMPELMKSLAP